MAIKVDVRGDMNRIISHMERTKRDVKDVAIVRALNKTIDQAYTATARKVRDAGYNLKISDIKKGLDKVRARPGSLTAKVVASGRPIPLIKYGARETSKGVSVNVLHGRKVIAVAFIATMPNGHKAVLVRVGDTHKRVNKNGHTRWSGLPVKELFGPGVPDGLANKSVQDALQQLIREKFPEILTQQIKYLTR